MYKRKRVDKNYRYNNSTCGDDWLQQQVSCSLATLQLIKQKI